MLTVREACKLFFTPKEILVSMDGRQYTLKTEQSNGTDAILMAYLGDYLVEDISATEEDNFYITVKMKPMTKEDLT